MAKKDPTDLTVEEKLKALYQLQTTLSAIDEKRALRGELPLEVQDLEDDIAGLTTRIEKIQTDIEQFDRAIDQKQNEIEEAQASVERYKKQLEMVSNNREYDTLSKEIEFQELEIELCSKKIREAQQVDRVPYMLVLGAKEAEAGNLSVRDRKGETTTMEVDEFIAKVTEEIKTRSYNA